MASQYEEQIARLQRQGYDKSEIVARLTGTRDNSGGASKLGIETLRLIGFSDRFIQQAKPNQWENRYGSTSGGGGGGSTGGGRTPTSGGGAGGAADPFGEDPFGGGDMGGGMSPESAYKMFANALAMWGIPVGSDIAAIIQKAAVDGLTPDMIDLIIPDIQNTSTWKNRFPGWHQRVSNGYSQITVGEYLALESAYHRIMQSAGLPSGFYDDPADFGQWIANNVSPDEIQDRVNGAMDLVRQVDPTARGLLTQFYGVDSGGIAAYFLDPKRALPTLARQYEAVNVASWAARYGLNLMNSSHWEDLVDKGVTKEMAAQGYGTVRQFYNVLGNLGQIHGIQYDQTDAERDVFFQNDEKRKKIVQAEVAAFSGSSGFRPGSSGRGSTAGSY